MSFQINKLMKQAQEMQKKMQQAQEKLTKLEMTGEAGAGLVKITVNGKHEVLSVKLSTEFAQEELAVQQDLIVAAVNDANRKISDASKNELSSLTAGLELPEGLGGQNE